MINQDEAAASADRTIISQPDESVCPACNGAGYEDNLDIMAAKHTRRKCPRCGGSGKRNPDGVRFRRQAGFLAVCERVKDEKAVATVLIHFWPAVPNTPLIVGDIIRMATRPKHRRKGYCTQIIVQMQIMKHILGLRTSWDDSDEAGRALLMKQGFTRKGNLLIWENKHAFGLIANRLQEKGRLEQLITGGRPVQPGRDPDAADQQPDNASAEPDAPDESAGRDSEDSAPRIAGAGR